MTAYLPDKFGPMCKDSKIYWILLCFNEKKAAVKRLCMLVCHYPISPV